MLPVTSVITAFAVLYLIILSIIVIVQRYRHKTALGYKQETQLERAVRVHGNFAEYTPFFLIALGLMEMAAIAPLVLWVLSILYLLGRLSHLFSLMIAEHSPKGWIRNVPYFRTFAMLMTFLVLSTQAIYLLITAIGFYGEVS